MSIYDRQFIQLKIAEWDSSKGTGVVVDRQGCRYEVRLEDMADEFRNTNIPITPGEICEGCVVDYDCVVSVISSQRTNEESSVGPAPLVGWDPHRGTPGTGRIRLGK